MKKFGVILGSLLFVMMLTSAAQAVPYSIQFDADAGGGYYSPMMIQGWDAESYATEEFLDLGVSPGVTVIDFKTYQEASGTSAYGAVLQDGDRFQEDLIFRVLNSKLGNRDYTQDTPANDAALFISVHLEGYITNLNPGADGFIGGTSGAGLTALKDDTFDSIFSTSNSTATFWYDAGLATGATFPTTVGIETADGGADDGYLPFYDGNGVNGDIQLATTKLSGALPFAFGPSLFTGTAANVDLQFTFDSPVNTNYFTGPPAFYTLVANGFALVIDGGRLYLNGVNSTEFAGWTGTSPYTDAIVLAWDDFGQDLRINAIPEPTSMLLLGTGLVGLAGASRRRRKKSPKA